MSNKPDGIPNAAYFGQLNALLARQGYTPDERKAAVGEKVSGRNRGQIANDLKAFTRRGR